VTGDIGKRGYQTDMDLEYQLVALSPTRWGRIEDPTCGLIGWVGYNMSGSGFGLGANVLNVQSGASGPRTLTATTRGSARVRSALNTGAVAGNTFYSRGTGGAQIACFGHGLRYRIVCGPGAVAAGMRWVHGLYDILGANVNQAPTVVLNALAVGADGGNLQIYTNDGAGPATATDLGASFPGVTAESIHEVEFYSPDGTDVRYSALNLGTGAEVSGTISSNLPAAGFFFNHGLFVTNNAQAAIVSADLASINIFQRSR
jgi:hypothetical protein